MTAASLADALNDLDHDDYAAEVLRLLASPDCPPDLRTAVTEAVAADPVWLADVFYKARSEGLVGAVGCPTCGKSRDYLFCSDGFHYVRREGADQEGNDG